VFGSRLAVVPGGALVVPSGSGGVGEWEGNEWGGSRALEQIQLWRPPNSPRQKEEEKYYTSSAVAVDVVVERVFAIAGIVVGCVKGSDYRTSPIVTFLAHRDSFHAYRTTAPTDMRSPQRLCPYACAFDRILCKCFRLSNNSVTCASLTSIPKILIIS